MILIKKYAWLLMACQLFVSSCSDSNVQNPENRKIEQRVEMLLRKMTLAEKAGQMTQVGIPTILEQEGYWDAADTLIIDTNKLRKALNEDHIGSFVGKGFYPPSRQEYYHFIKQIQDFALNETRLAIPIVYATDAVHGAHYTAKSTIFPHQIAMAATWNPALTEKMAEITAYELRASNTPWNYAPVVDISWQAQWGRIYETFGEDTYLTSSMGKAFSKGAQSDSMANSEKTALCLKHLIGYGSPLYGKDRKNTLMPERFIRQYYLPPFQEAIKSGVKSVMISSGLVNSIPCHVNKFLITELLKEELGFTGVAISDWGDMQFLSDFHKTAPNYKAAVEQMVNAGIDMCMVPYDASFAHHVIDLVNEGAIPLTRIDDAVRRILTFKFELGLFEQPNTHFDDYPDFGSKKFAKESYRAAAEGITLLKNNDILPLEKGKKILVTGVAAHSLNYLNGPWTRSWSGQDTSYNDNEKNTIFEALIEKNGAANTSYYAGTSYDADLNTKETLKAAKDADCIVICLGEQPATERPSDIKELYLPKAQRQFVKELHKTGKPIVLVLVQGRTRIISDLTQLADGIIMAYYPSHEGGDALADILLGDVNPSGKLPLTYQKYAAAPMPYIHTVTDRADNFGGYTDYDPQWPFGFGLSYTEFTYDKIALNKKELTKNDSLMVAIQLTNSGKRTGKEVVQLYLRDEYASIDPDFERLIRFKKVTLLPGETKEIEFKISQKDLAFVSAENKWITESGEFTLATGNRMDQKKSVKFTLKSNTANE
ncbi:MAG: glycoside hydrolase family 3 N-terminal domain-containing protein [Flavobacteriales bacterium]|nr:glycoside hydrolase family 3 N-terminal domain-containing protein [Flavobacteriales bacterium]